MEVRIDLSDFDHIINKFSKRKQRVIISSVINGLLYETRKYAVESGMKKEFKIRTKGLVRRHIVYTKSTPSRTVGYFGSTPTKRFSGWEEQETGASTDRDIVVHIGNVRGSLGARKLPKKFRRNNKQIVNLLTNQRGTTTDIARITANINILRREGEKKPVDLPVKYYKREPGIYEFRFRKIKKSKKKRRKEQLKRRTKNPNIKSKRLYNKELVAKAKTYRKTKQPEINKWGTNIIITFLRDKKTIDNIVNSSFNRIITRFKK